MKTIVLGFLIYIVFYIAFFAYLIKTCPQREDFD